MPTPTGASRRVRRVRRVGTTIGCFSRSPTPCGRRPGRPDGGSGD